jgi:glycosyltransferase involved in cell wall biosynthesis
MTKVALVHDYLVNMGGSEKVLEQLIELYPDAPVYTSVYKPESVSEKINSAKIYTSFLQKLPGSTERWQLYLLLMPTAFARFNLQNYDLVITSSHACAKEIRLPEEVCQICYCHTPMRYAWSAYEEYREASGGMQRIFFPLIMSYLRNRDRESAKKVTHFVCNSNAVKERIARYYGREAVVIAPPADTSFYFPGGDKDDFYLVVSRFIPYKKVDLAVAAFTKLNLPLVVVGATVGYGSWEEELRRKAGKNVVFVGSVGSEKLRDYYRRARAYVFPQEEDFGITAVEAQACGTPVIAYASGGALDIVEEGVTGVFFREQTPDALRQAVLSFEGKEFDAAQIRRSAERFSSEMFRQKMKSFTDEKYLEFKG